MRQSLDNVTVVMVAFQHFKKSLFASPRIHPTPPLFRKSCASKNDTSRDRAEKENIIN